MENFLYPKYFAINNAEENYEELIPFESMIEDINPVANTIRLVIEFEPQYTQKVTSQFESSTSNNEVSIYDTDKKEIILYSNIGIDRISRTSSGGAKLRTTIDFKGTLTNVDIQEKQQE